MRNVTLRVWCLLAGVLVLVGGCQRVNMAKTVNLEALSVSAPFIVTGPSRDQDVTVTVSPEKGTPVDVYILLEKDRAAAEQAMQASQVPKNTLAGKQKIESETTVTAKVPAKSEYAVVVGGAAKSTKVTLKLEAR